MPKLLSTSAFCGAVFDKRRRYRYLLWRRWDDSLPGICFVMLNPSAADEHHNDPTIARCEGFARRWGFGRLDVVNAFSFCTTDSTVLRNVHDPVGRLTNRFISDTIIRSETIVLGWGNLGLINNRCLEVGSILGARPMSAFGLTKQLQPKHPLYLRNDAQLVTVNFKEGVGFAISSGAPILR